MKLLTSHLVIFIFNYFESLGLESNLTETSHFKNGFYPTNGSMWGLGWVIFVREETAPELVNGESGVQAQVSIGLTPKPGFLPLFLPQH